MMHVTASEGQSVASSTSIDDGAEALLTSRRRQALGLACIAGCDVRTAARALEHGVDAIRPRRLREEIRSSLVKLGVGR